MAGIEISDIQTLAAGNDLIRFMVAEVDGPTQQKDILKNLPKKGESHPDYPFVRVKSVLIRDKFLPPNKRYRVKVTYEPIPGLSWLNFVWAFAPWFIRKYRAVKPSGKPIEYWGRKPVYGG